MSKLLNQERPIVAARRARERQVETVEPEPAQAPPQPQPPPSAPPARQATPPAAGPQPAAPEPHVAPVPATPTRLSPIPPVPTVAPAERVPRPRPSSLGRWWVLSAAAVGAALLADLWMYAQEQRPVLIPPEPAITTTAVPRGLPTLFGIRPVPARTDTATDRRQVMDQALAEAQRVISLMDAALRRAAGAFASADAPPAGPDSPGPESHL